MHPRLTARPARQTQVVKGLEDAQPLEVIQARGIGSQRVLGTLEDATTCTANPKLAGFLVFRVRGTLDVHELNFDLRRGKTKSSIFPRRVPCHLATGDPLTSSWNP